MPTLHRSSSRRRQVQRRLTVQWRAVERAGKLDRRLQLTPGIAPADVSGSKPIDLHFGSTGPLLEG